MGTLRVALLAVMLLGLFGCTPARPVLDRSEAVPLAQSQEFAVQAEVQIRRAPDAGSGGEIIINFELTSLRETTLEEGNVALWLPDGLREVIPDFVDNLYQLRPSGSPTVDLKSGMSPSIGVAKRFSDYSQWERVRRIFEDEPCYVQVTWKGGKRTLEVPGAVWRIRLNE